ncbi:MAG: AraC family transcriptional regulator [Myxococcota bacterium]
MDALSQILTTLRMEAGVFSRAALRSPWAVSSKKLPVALFHVVVRGSGRLERDGHPPVAWVAGDLLVLPQGTAHVMAAGPAVSPRPIGSLPAVIGEDGLPCVEGGGTGEETLLLCGTFRLHPEARGIVLGHLPGVLHVRPSLDGTAGWLDASLRLLTAEQLARGPGSAALSTRLAEMLFIQVLRGYIEDHPSESGWLAALSDPDLAPAMAAIHGDISVDWTAAELARRCAMSRSIFFDRFRAAVGQTPLNYLTHWRMLLASVSLADGLSLGEAADRVGYTSEASFSKAFKRNIGVPPGAYRRGQRP